MYIYTHFSMRKKGKGDKELERESVEFLILIIFLSNFQDLLQNYIDLEPLKYIPKFQLNQYFSIK